MSIAHLMNHRAVLYRNVPWRDEFHDEVENWMVIPSPAGLNCRPDQNWSGTLQDHGPGEQQGASRRWFLLPGFDVAERDVLDIADGPEAPLRLRVLSVTKPTTLTPLAHHIEVNVEVWHGELPGDS